VAGGTESPICRACDGWICAARALSTGFTNAAHLTPYDKDREECVEGEARIVVLRQYEHAKKGGGRRSTPK